ncbi:MAG: family 2 glycosyl transferase [Frankiales bacterium]|nr:family 2 glycosyl transferase [Frankiales bacterium]
MTQPTPVLSVSVVICTYTERRWTELSAGVAAVLGQLKDGDELLVVVDHAAGVLARAQAQFEGCRVEANTHGQGLSGARNTGVDHATGDLVAFLDDDATPGEGWLESLRAPFAAGDVLGVAGRVDPAWEGGRAPRWFPPEFGWVVGCDYVGLPEGGAQVRNPIGASMALRRAPLVAVGGFSELVGRVGTLPVGCEETEIAIRLAQNDPTARVLRAAGGTVHHLVPRDRQKLAYFRSRCWHEGRSKAVLSTLVGTQQGLASERAYATRTLPVGVLRHLAAVGRGDLAGAARACCVVLGLLTTAAGYLSARTSGRVT